MSKRERYFSGLPLRDPSQPLPNEVPPSLKQNFIKAAIVVGLIGAGVILGMAVSPEGPRELEKRVTELEEMLAERNERIAELNRQLSYGGVASTSSRGLLRPADRHRHEQFVRQYAVALKKA